MEDNWEGLRNWRFTWGRALEQPAKLWKWASKPRGATRFRWKRSSQPTKPQLRRLPHNLSIKFIVLHSNRLSFVLLASFVSYFIVFPLQKIVYPDHFQSWRCLEPGSSKILKNWNSLKWCPMAQELVYRKVETMYSGTTELQKSKDQKIGISGDTSAV